MDKSRWATISLILGIFCFVHFLGAEKGILAVIFGVLALREISKNPAIKGRGKAIVGIILGLAGVVVACYLAFCTPFLRNLINAFSSK